MDARLKEGVQLRGINVFSPKNYWQGLVSIPKFYYYYYYFNFLQLQLVIANISLATTCHFCCQTKNKKLKNSDDLLLLLYNSNMLFR